MPNFGKSGDGFARQYSSVAVVLSMYGLGMKNCTSDPSNLMDNKYIQCCSITVVGGDFVLLHTVLCVSMRKS